MAGEAETDLEGVEGDDALEGTDTTAAPAIAPNAGAVPAPPVLGAGGKTIPATQISAIKEQIRRQTEERTRAALLAELGIQDPKAFKTQREREAEELRAFKEAEEQRKREAMSEQERLATDLERERERVAALESELTELRETKIADEQRAKLEAAASKFINPKFLRYAVRTDFRTYVQELAKTDRKALKALDDRAVERWFREWAKDNPEMALKAAEAPPAPAPETPSKPAAPSGKPTERKVIKRPITTGPSPRAVVPTPAPGTGNGTATQKTFRPGQPNSMSKREAREEAAKLGIRLPS